MTEATPTEDFEVTEEVRPYVYDRIPQLNDLLPTTGGIPGVTYLQCCIQNQRKAQDVGWGPIVGGSKVYTIKGPRGLADMCLLCQGKPIPGGDIHSGNRKCMVDALVEELTGLWVNGPPEEPEATPEPDPPKPKADLKVVE